MHFNFQIVFETTMNEREMRELMCTFRIHSYCIYSHRHTHPQTPTLNTHTYKHLRYTRPHTLKRA